jgi:hypothetical protein
MRDPSRAGFGLVRLQPRRGVRHSPFTGAARPTADRAPARGRRPGVDHRELAKPLALSTAQRPPRLCQSASGYFGESNQRARALGAAFLALKQGGDPEHVISARILPWLNQPLARCRSTSNGPGQIALGVALFSGKLRQGFHQLLRAHKHREKHVSRVWRLIPLRPTCHRGGSSN